MINRYSTISEKNFDLYVPPVEAIGAALQTAQKTYDTNFMFANELKNKYLNALPQDRARANELQSGWEKQVDDLVKKYNGDYSTASKDLYLLQKDIEKQYRQGGEAAAIETNYALLQDSMKRNKERLAKGEVTQELYQGLYDYVDKNYQGVKKQDDGTYSNINIPELAKYVDTTKAAREVVRDIKPRTTKQTVRVDLGNGEYRLDTQEVSQVDPNEVRNAIAGAIMSNEEYLNYAKQLAMFTGKDPAEVVGQELNTVYNAVGPAASGVFNDSREMGKTEMDPFTKMKIQHQFSMAEEYQKQRNRVALAEAKGEIAPPEGQGNLRMIASVNNAMSQYKPIDAIEGIRAPQTVPDGKYNMFSPAPGGFVPQRNVAVSKPSKATVDEVLKNKDKYTNINTELLGAIKSKNPKYTDRQVIDQYNRSLARQNQNEGVYIEAYRNPTTGKASADLILPYLQAGNAKATFIGNDGRTRSLTPTEQQAYAAKLIESKARSLGQVRGFSGGLPVGETFPVPGGYISVASNSVGISKYNEEYRSKMFDFTGEPRIAGEVFPLGGGINAQGVKLAREETDAQGLKYTTTDAVYMAVDKEGKVILKKDGTPDYFTVTEQFPDGSIKERYATPLDMEMKVLTGQIRNQDIPVKTISGNKDYNAKYEIH